MKRWTPLMRMRVLLPTLVLMYVGAGVLLMFSAVWTHLALTACALLGIVISVFLGRGWLSHYTDLHGRRHEIEAISIFGWLGFAYMGVMHVGALVVQSSTVPFWPELTALALWVMIGFAYASDRASKGRRQDERDGVRSHERL